MRYTQSANPIAVANYSLAVRRQYAKEGQPDVDFINCVAFGKSGEFAQKYFQKGQMVAVVGRIQTGSYTNKEGIKIYTTDVIIEEQHFAESNRQARGHEPVQEDFRPVELDEDLPF